MRRTVRLKHRPPNFLKTLDPNHQAYLEFFCSPENFSKLVAEISKDPSVTYYAVNKQGDLRTNTTSEGPNAVTWGVFPGKEIVQPTIVEQVSFMAWKVRSPVFFCSFSLTDGFGFGLGKETGS